MYRLDHVPLAQIDFHPDNPKERLKPDAELKASIEAFGILCPIGLKKKGKRYVCAFGNRRIANAKRVQPKRLKQLFGASVKVPSVIFPETMSDAEVRLAENQIREGLSPMQECADYARALADEGATIAAVAARFGKPVPYVEQRLALSKLIDPIKALVDAGTLGLDAAAVLTTATAAEQKKLLPQLKHGASHYNIRAWLRDTGSTTANALPGVKQTYLKAGGKIIEDLFGQEHRVEDADLFGRLQREAADHMLAEATEKYSHAQIIEIGPHDFSWRNGLGYLSPNIKDKKRLCWFLVRHADGRYEVLADQYVEGRDPKAKKPSKAKEAIGKALEKGDPLPATKALYRRMNLFGLAKVRAAMIEDNSVRIAKALLITARIGGYMPEFSQILTRPSDNGIIDELCKTEEGSAHNRDLIAGWTKTHRAPQEAGPSDDLKRTELFGAVMALSDLDLDRLFVSVVTDSLASPDGEGPMKSDTVFAAIAGLLSVENNGYKPDDWFFSQLKVARLKEIAKQEGVEGEKRGDLIARLAAKFDDMPVSAAERDWPELLLAKPQAADAPARKKKAA